MPPPRFECICGAQREAIEIFEINDYQPQYVPGPLIEECRCPRCPYCTRKVDRDGRCENLDCLYVGLHVIIPERHHDG